MNLFLFIIGVALILFSIVFDFKKQEQFVNFIPYGGYSLSVVGQECFVPKNDEYDYIFSGTKINKDGTAQSLSKGVEVDGGYMIQSGQTVLVVKKGTHE